MRFYDFGVFVVAAAFLLWGISALQESVGDTTLLEQITQQEESK